MKLRLRSIETNQTLKIEIPNSSSLQNLKQALSLQINSSPDSIHLSLNRKEELLSTSPQQTIESFGIISGDLLFFSLNFNMLTSTRPVLQQESPPVVVVDSHNIENMEVDTVNLNTLEENCVNLGAEEKIVDLGTQISANSETLINMDDVKEGGVGLDDTQMDENGDDFDVAKSFSVPGFLRKVFVEELGDSDGNHHKLLVIAVHAVLLESGFVGYDPCNNVVIKGFNIPEKWPSSAFILSLWYTLPEINNRDGVEVNGVETVVLKFASMGKFFSIYGSLSMGSRKHCVSVNEDQLVPFLNLIWANCLPGSETNENGVVLSTDPAREVFAFWRAVKDKLVSPLLIDLCDKVGLELPPCFMRLPTDLKLQILALLPGLDVAKVGSTCSELRYLSSSDDLWKKKFVEQFGDAEPSDGGAHWKEKFAKSMERRKKRRISVNTTLLRNDRHPFPGQFPGLFPGRLPGPFPGHFPGPFPGPFPGVIGGDYDILPLNIPLPNRRNPRFNNVLPHRNLGGLG